MYYHILIGTPAREMSGYGFSIQLWPEWKRLVEKSALDQSGINRAIDRLTRGWLDTTGHDVKMDDGEFLYQPYSIRVAWGEWGPEHITVPGNACGLDIDRGISAPRDGRVLAPHNVDGIRQAYLLIMVFSFLQIQ